MQKSVALPFHSIVASGVTTVKGVTSQPYKINYLDNVGIEFTWTGSASFSGVPQVLATVSEVNYSTLTLDTVPSCTGTSGTILFNLNQIPFARVKLSFIPTAGSGTVDAWFQSKGLS